MDAFIDDTTDHGKEIFHLILCKIAEDCCLKVFKKESLQLSINNVVTLREVAGLGSNELYRVSAALASLLPEVQIFPM